MCEVGPPHPRPHVVETSGLRLFFPPPRASAAARCALIGRELAGCARSGCLVTKGGSPARAVAASSVSGRRRRLGARHAEPQGQPQCLLLLRAREDSRTAQTRPACGPCGGCHPLLLSGLGGEAEGGGRAVGQQEAEGLTWACQRTGGRGQRRGGEGRARPGQAREVTGGRGLSQGGNRRARG